MTFHSQSLNSAGVLPKILQSTLSLHPHSDLFLSRLGIRALTTLKFYFPGFPHFNPGSKTEKRVTLSPKSNCVYIVYTGGGTSLGITEQRSAERAKYARRGAATVTEPLRLPQVSRAFTT